MANSKLVVAILSLLVFISFCFVHLTGDFDCFLAWARMTHNSTVGGIASLSEIWELKGCLLRAFFLFLYNCASVFAPDTSLWFAFAFKFIGGLLVAGVLYAAVVLFPESIVEQKNKNCFFCFLSIFIFACHFSFHLQAEFLAVPLLLLGTALYLRDSLIGKLLAGAIVGLVFLLKSPIPLMGGSLFFSAMLLKKTTFKQEIRSILPLVGSMVLTIALAMVVLRIFAPQEIQDMLDASTFQHTLFSDFATLKRAPLNFISNLLFNTWYSPACALLLLWFAASVGKWKTAGRPLALMALSVLFPCVYVLISNCYFVYHYYLFVYPFLVLLLFGYQNRENLQFSLSKRFIWAVVITFVVALIVNAPIYRLSLSIKVLGAVSFVILLMAVLKKTRSLSVLVTSCLIVFSYVVNNSAISAAAIRSNISYNEALNTVVDGHRFGTNLGNQSVLFLEPGTCSYFMTNRSYLRHFYPLPIQRIDEKNASFVSSSNFKAEQNLVLDYKGEYILLDESWFFQYPHPLIKQFIEANYQLVQTADFPVYTWNLFCYSQLSYSKIKVYKRIAIANP